MAVIINGSINLSKIPKDKIIDGKKGKYLPISITVNDELDQFGNQGPIKVAQSKEERDNKVEQVFLGNVNVAWTNNKIEKLDKQQQSNPVAAQSSENAGLPF